jgi:phytoene/squalene synthetase
MQKRAYATIEELIEYCVRVASTVGVMMAVVMGGNTRALDAARLDRNLPILAHLYYICC